MYWINFCNFSSAVVDTMFVDIYVDTKNIPTCRYVGYGEYYNLSADRACPWPVANRSR